LLFVPLHDRRPADFSVNTSHHSAMKTFQSLSAPGPSPPASGLAGKRFPKNPAAERSAPSAQDEKPLEPSRERRRFKRIFFSEKDNVIALFSFLGNNDLLIETAVLDLCETGIRLMAAKDGRTGLRAGDILLLREIIGAPPLSFLRNIRTQIRWVLNHQFLTHIGFGCEFLDMAPDGQEQLDEALINLRMGSENPS